MGTGPATATKNVTVFDRPGKAQTANYAPDSANARLMFRRRNGTGLIVFMHVQIRYRGTRVTARAAARASFAWRERAAGHEPEPPEPPYSNEDRGRFQEMKDAVGP